jgi:hypothetical protein
MKIRSKKKRVGAKPPKDAPRKARIVTDPISGLPVLSGSDAPVLTSKQVAKMLSNFP